MVRLHSAVTALDLKKGMKLLLPMTFVQPQVVLYQGEIKFADINIKLNIDQMRLKKFQKNKSYNSCRCRGHPAELIKLKKS